MDRQLMESFRRKLQEEAVDLDAQIAAYGRLHEESLKESVQELSSYDNHPADHASETWEREKDAALLDNVRDLRRQVAEALSRTEQGTYGRCARCAREIDRERLEAVPYTALCLDCRRDAEKVDPPRLRPIEEEVLHPAFGRSFRDDSDEVEFDGEDAWQAVAGYGTSNSPQDVGGTDTYEEIYIDHDEARGLVEKIDAVIGGSPEEIPPDPHKVVDSSP